MGSRYKVLDDAQLAELIQQQDTYAFEALYKRYWKLLFSFARKSVNTDQDAEDIVQETFASLYLRSTTINAEYPIKAYLYTIVRHKLINFFKSSSRKADFFASYIDFCQDGSIEADALVREKELARLIEEEIENLPPKMRTIFELSRKKYLTRKEIAEMQNISEGTVKKQLQVALNRLRSKFGCMFWLSIMQFILWLNRSF